MEAQTSVTPDQLFQIASGFMASKLLFAASEAGIFAALSDGPKDLNSLAGRLQRPPRTTRILADAMVALGVLELHADRYGNGAAADAFLAGRTPADLRPFLRFWNSIAYPRWEHLDECVATGQPAKGDFSLSPQQQRIFSEGVAAVTAGAAMALSEKYDFSQHSKLLDLGGGTGSFLRVILQRYPALRGTLYDQPEVIVVAEQHLKDLSDRVDFVAGNFMTDGMPSGHDAILAANVIHYFSPAGNRELLTSIRNAVIPSAKLLLVDFWMNREHTQPVGAALMSGEFLVNLGEGQSYSVDEMRSWCEATKWRFIEHIPLAGPQSLVVAQAI